MNDVTLIIDHYVLIVPVFDLENIANEGISRERSQESSLGSSETSALFLAFSVALNIEVIE